MNKTDDLPDPLQTMIRQSINASIRDSNQPIVREICNYINQKKGNCAHDAVFALLSCVNKGSKEQKITALSLLGNIVSRCGFPVHYQIASLEFLNVMFQYFIGSKTNKPSSMHFTKLQLLEKWYISVYLQSRYTVELCNIKIVRERIQANGWLIPYVSHIDAGVNVYSRIIPKPEEELKNDDLDVMQVKLQDALRRGTPSDLKEANRLMKVIIGEESPSEYENYGNCLESTIEGIRLDANILIEMLVRVRLGAPMSESIPKLRLVCCSNRVQLREMIAQISESKHFQNMTEYDRQALTRLYGIDDLITVGLKSYSSINIGCDPEESADPLASHKNMADKSSKNDLIILNDAANEDDCNVTTLQGLTHLNNEQKQCLEDAKSYVVAFENLLSTVDTGKPVLQSVRRMRGKCINSLREIQKIVDSTRSIDSSNVLSWISELQQRIQAALAEYSGLRNGRLSHEPKPVNLMDTMGFVEFESLRPQLLPSTEAAKNIENAAAGHKYSFDFHDLEVAARSISMENIHAE